MKKLILTFCSIVLLTACHEFKQQPQGNWNDGYDPKHPECFDTIVNESGDSLLIINMATDSKM